MAEEKKYYWLKLKDDFFPKLIDLHDKIKDGLIQKNSINDLQDEVDIVVYKMYDLEYSEVLKIDPNFNLTKEEYNNYTIG